MAERNQVGRALGRHDARQARRREHVALAARAHGALDQTEGRRLIRTAADVAASRRSPAWRRRRPCARDRVRPYARACRPPAAHDSSKKEFEAADTALRAEPLNARRDCASSPGRRHPGPQRMRLPSLDSLTERQVSLLVILFGLIVYIPFAGSYGLYDPWETHYAEVARQMAVRGDYVSLWWPGAPIDPDHFWSKPVLSFWVMSLSCCCSGSGHPASGHAGAVDARRMGGAPAVHPVRRARHLRRLPVRVALREPAGRRAWRPW